MEFTSVQNGAIALNVAVAGRGPLILCVHGWPELWYSWRHQLAHFSKAGYTVAALDVRGYGGSSKPHDIAAYSLREIASDVAAVIDALGGGRGILFGHDWGAPIVWASARLHADKVAAVAGLSVPHIPFGQVSLIDLAKELFKDRFFYQLYFQEEGVAEAELEADIRATLRKTYYAGCGSAPLDKLMERKPPDAKFLDGMIDPDPFPNWLSEDGLEILVAAFKGSGFRGPLNRYRAQNIDFQELKALPPMIAQPAFFVAGERDPVRNMIAGVDLYQAAGVACADFRGCVLVPGAGHWIQQEAPRETNDALGAFLGGL